MPNKTNIDDIISARQIKKKQTHEGGKIYSATHLATQIMARVLSLERDYCTTLG